MYQIKLIPEAGVIYEDNHNKAIEKTVVKKLRSIEQQINEANGVIIITCLGNEKYVITTEGLPVELSNRVKEFLQV